jgi:dolichyl-phosphate-mannose--protein O-mannosyl transferase
MSILTHLSVLSTPAIIYFVIAILLILIDFINIVTCIRKTNSNPSSCNNIEEQVLVTFGIIIVTCVWTWLIDLVYRRGYHKTAWVMLVMFPSIIL